MAPDEVRAALRQRIAAFEGRNISFDDVSFPHAGKVTSSPGQQKKGSNALPRWHFGLDEVDHCLANGSLSLRGLHEIRPASWPDMWAAAGFATALLSRLLNGLQFSLRNTLLWCLKGRLMQETGRPYGPGLPGLGLDPGRVVFARGEQDLDVLWAMEEGLGSGLLAGVMGEAENMTLTQSRRLLLAAEKTGVPALFLRASSKASPSAARTRWQVQAAPGAGDARWQVQLLKCRDRAGAGEKGETPSWILEWNHETHCFHLAAPLADQPADAVWAGRTHASKRA